MTIEEARRVLAIITAPGGLSQCQVCLIPNAPGEWSIWLKDGQAPLYDLQDWQRWNEQRRGVKDGVYYS